ncbi:MAG: hypothetical protein JXB15_12725 [Anaerolineales bacterium]|nr:hypothetical protein [Anaerolineales bacterium]
MKRFPWYGPVRTVIALALVVGAGMAQASPNAAAGLFAAPGERWAISTFSGMGNGSHVSLAFSPASGIPWISYYEDLTSSLVVGHFVGSGGNCGPNTSWECHNVDVAGSMGMFSSIDIYPDTNPDPFISTWKVGVAYYDADHGALKFAEYTCFMGSCGWDVVTVQDADYVGAPVYGQYASLKYSPGGKAQIAFYVSNLASDDALNFAYEVTSEGSCGEGAAAGLWECEEVDSGDHLGQYASLDTSTFMMHPFIAYYDGGAGDLKFAYYDGTAGSCGDGNRWHCFTMDGTDGSDQGKFVSIHVPERAGDKMQFAYYDATHGKLRYAVETSGVGNCSPWNGYRCDDIEAVGAGLAQVGISLAVDLDNIPLIAYRDQTAPGEPSDLKVAQPAYSLGLTYGNCGPETPFSTWQCAAIDEGWSGVDMADYASLAFSPSGLAMIAYSSWITYGDPDYYALRYAYQQALVYLPVVRR